MSPSPTDSQCSLWKQLTHWGRVTHICISKITIIGSDNGLSPGRRQTIIWTNVGILFIGPLGTNFNETSIEIHTFLFKKIHLKLPSGKWRPFCLGLNVLTMPNSYFLSHSSELDHWTRSIHMKAWGQFHERFFHRASNLMEIYSVLIQVAMKWSLSNSAHGMTAQLSYHVQNFIVISYPTMKLCWEQFSTKFEFVIEKYFVKWAPGYLTDVIHHYYWYKSQDLHLFFAQALSTSFFNFHQWDLVDLHSIESLKINVRFTHKNALQVFIRDCTAIWQDTRLSWSCIFTLLYHSLMLNWYMWLTSSLIGNWRQWPASLT